MGCFIIPLMRAARPILTALAVAAVCLGSLSLAQTAPEQDPLLQAAAKPVFILPIEDMISDVTMQGLERRIDEAREQGAELIVLEMNTPGGLVTSALDICTYLKQLDIQTLAWVRPDAYSAGAMISLACDGVIMSPRSRIGDCAPIMLGADGGLEEISATERAKIESPILEEFRDSARRNGYPLVLCEAMVRLGPAIYMIRHTSGEVRYVWANDLPRFGLSDSEAAKLPGPLGPEADDPDTDGEPASENDDAPAEDEQSAAEAAPAEETKDAAFTQPAPISDGNWQLVKRVNPQNTLLTLSQDEAVEYGFARRIIADEDELAAFVNATSVTRIETMWSEDLVAFLTSPAVRGILMLVLVIGLYMELQSPGLGLPGGLALLALVVLVGAPFIAGLASVLDIVLIVLGLVLLGVEIFVLPGFGIAGILGIALLGTGLIMTFVENDPGPGFWPSLPGTWEMLQTGMITVLLAMLAAAVAVMLLIRYFGSIPLVNRLVLSEQQAALTGAGAGAGSGVSAADTAPLRVDSLVDVGAIGRVITGLRPVGRAEFDGNLVDVVTLGSWIDAGLRVRVIEARGNRIVVEEVA